MADLKQALVMCDGKQRAEVLRDWEFELNAPMGGWARVDREMRRAIGLM